MKVLVSLVLMSVLLSACGTLSYYGQAVSGQLYILTHRRQIDALVVDKNTDPGLKAQLELILQIRAFAESELNLPLEGAYSTYVDIERPFVVWNVFAAPEFSLEPQSWCYPVAGCVSYRGYFREDVAREFADNLRQRDFDTYVGGVAAYSTLGWFDDPVLSTLLNREDYQLATLIFHELAHRVAYVPGDTEFNESFATTVEQEGLRRWLAASDSDSGREREILERVSIAERRREQFVTLVQDTVEELENLYQSRLEARFMRERKLEVIERLRSRYQKLRESWGGYDGYDNWFSQDLNNAKLSTVSTYFRLVPAFQALLLQEEDQLPSFYSRVRELGNLQPEERLSELTRLL